MIITTKEVFQWNNKTEKYDSIECESYEYSGEVDQCDTAPHPCNESDSWWTGKNSLWCKIQNYVDTKPGLDPLGADKGSFSLFGAELGWDNTNGDSSFYFDSDSNRGGAEAEVLKYGIVLVGAYMLMRR